jgi:NAD(P)-dependent dehydrogenase (short-subunit alcohol dehydrogenase family)
LNNNQWREFMTKRFESKVALVTGGTSGLGRDAAIAFASEGAKVVVTGRRKKEGEETVGMIKKTGGVATFVQADLSNPGDIESMVRACARIYGGLDCAFNNAGIDGTIRTPLTAYSLEVWNQVMAVNLTGMFLCMKYEIAEMLKRGGGSIVNMGAVASKKASPVVGVAYVTSKHGVVGLTQTGAIEYAEKGIRINAVCPGVIHTPLSARTLLLNEEMQKRAQSMHPIGRVGEPAEVSSLVLWLCSDEASFVTGAIIPVDGGFLLR